MRPNANPTGWYLEEEGGYTSATKTYLFESRKKLLEFIKASLELSDEFALTPTLRIEGERVSLNARVPSNDESELQRLTIFCKVIDNAYIKLQP